MKGFARFPAPAVAAVIVAIGLLGGTARAEYLVHAAATVNAPGDAPGSVAGSNVTLTATYAPAPGGPAQPDVTYSWTLAYAHDGAGTTVGAASYHLTTHVDGGTPLGVHVPTAGGLGEPVLGFFALGSTLYFQLAGGITPSGGVDASAPFNVGVEVNTATRAVDIAMVSAHGLGPVVLAGNFTPVPEPSTIALLGAGGGLLLLVPRLRRRFRLEG